MASGFEGLHPSAARVAQVLIDRGIRGPFREFSVSTKTSRDAALALGCEVGAIASCLVFVLDEEPVVILKSGAFRVDPEQFAAVTGGTSLRRASADEVRSATGQPIGGVSPVGWPSRLRVFIDDSLATYDEIWSACGTPNAVFATTYEELRQLTNAVALTLIRP
jgi:prolyl-tRNA editing enzyme YbaK/EbsC (Cys-tRNA(Pro) deacylase)